MDLESLDRGAARTAGLLRVQLAQMTAASQLLEQTATDAGSREQLAALNQSICRMLRIVGRMELTYRLGADAPRLEPALVNLAELVRELGREMTALLAGAGVELSVRCPERMSAFADGGLIRQLLLELTSNGAKAGKRVSVTLTKKGDSASLTVEDDGPGLPPEKLETLFSGGGEKEPDWRKSGNGVAIARRIAALHGGRLMADAAPGRGLRMVVTIPLGLDRVPGLLESPPARWKEGGFSEALVGLSDLLPAGLFAPKETE